MAKKENRSIRARRAEMEAQRRRQRIIWGVFSVGALLMLLSLFAWIRQVNAPKLEELILPDDLMPPPNADGRAWGPSDAPVLIEEFSDFQ